MIDTLVIRADQVKESAHNNKKNNSGSGIVTYSSENPEKQLVFLHI